MNLKYLKLWNKLTLAEHGNLAEDLKNTLRAWEEGEYASDKERWQSYAQDITELVDYYDSEAGWKKKKSKKSKY